MSIRLACNKLLRQTVLHRAFNLLRTSAWARGSYDARRTAGKTRFKGLRALANRWLDILHHLLCTHQRYDEAIHQRNCAKAQLTAA